MQDLGSRELGGRTPEAMHRAGSEGRCAELVVKTGGGIALQECPQFWDSDHGRHGGGGGVQGGGRRSFYQSPTSTESTGTLHQGLPFTGPSFACWDRPPLTLDSGYRVLLMRTWPRDGIGCTYLTIWGRGGGRHLPYFVTGDPGSENCSHYA